MHLPDSAVLTTAICQRSTGECLSTTRIEDTRAAIRVGPRKISRQQLDVARGARDFALRTHENATAGVDAQLEECPLGHFDLT